MSVLRDSGKHMEFANWLMISSELTLIKTEGIAFTAVSRNSRGLVCIL